MSPVSISLFHFIQNYCLREINGVYGRKTLLISISRLNLLFFPLKPDVLSQEGCGIIERSSSAVTEGNNGTSDRLSVQMTQPQLGGNGTVSSRQIFLMSRNPGALER